MFLLNVNVFKDILKLSQVKELALLKIICLFLSLYVKLQFVFQFLEIFSKDLFGTFINNIFLKYNFKNKKSFSEAGVFIGTGTVKIFFLF